jgi:hypothetical protein
MGMFEDELNQERDRLNGKFFDQLVKFPKGKGVVVARLLSNKELPLRKGGLFTATRLHYVNGKGLHCPRELVNTQNGEFWKGPCPICEYYGQLWDDIRKLGGQEAEEAKPLVIKARGIRPVERYYYNCIVRQETNEETGAIEYNVGPKILPVGKTIHEIIIRGITGSKEDPADKGYGNVTDPINGRDFRIIKGLKGTGKDAYPEYNQSKFDANTSPLGDPDQVADWLSKLHDLTTLRVCKSYDELMHQLRVHFGIEKEETSSRIDLEGSMGQSAPKVEVVTTEVEPVVSHSEHPEAQGDAGSESENLADDEFLRELQGM